MADDAIKALLFAGALAGVYLLARLARGISDQAKAPPGIPAPEQESLESRLSVRSSGLVGNEIPFPFDVRELEAKYGSNVWRPIVLNYFFRETDLVSGPLEAGDFYDEFFIEWEHPESGYRWRTSFYVATPKGLERVMTENRTDHLSGDMTIVVRRYDLKVIVRAVIESIIEANDPSLQVAREPAPEPEQSS